MSYVIHFKGKTPSIEVDNAKGSKLWELWFSNKHKDMPVDAGGGVGFLIGDIKGMERKADVDLKTVALPATSVPGSPRCKGQYSIQLEIMRIARDVSGRKSQDNPQGLKWTKLLQDQTWKEETRAVLRATGAQWCDAKVGECACDQSKPGRGMGDVRAILGNVVH
jgi:hypothetical protein